MSVSVVDARDERALAGLYAGGWDPPQDVRDGVAAIVADVRNRGDDALVDLTRRFDAPGATRETLRVPVPPLDEAERAIPSDVAAALRLARDRVRAFHAEQLVGDVEVRDADGTVNALVWRPLDAIAAYVPGGSAVLPSSVLMGTIPARVAGVRRVAVATPPRSDGSVHAAVLFACALCGVDEIYAVGGAQAIAAFAYGTATVARVDKIVGPGNVWVTEAKRQVFGVCGIDGLAGPSEVLVVADADARPDLVAGELLAQAEHDPLARVAAVSEDRALLDAVAALLDGPFASEAGRSDIVARVLAERTWLVHASDRAALLDVVERFAPEHLSLQVRDPWSYVPQIRRAGALFVGPQTPVAAGDYLAGSNHVLPTSGAGRFSSGLRTADFMRTMSVVAYSDARMAHDAAPLETLAAYEGLTNHARTARMRASANTRMTP